MNNWLSANLCPYRPSIITLPFANINSSGATILLSGTTNIPPDSRGCEIDCQEGSPSNLPKSMHLCCLRNFLQNVCN
jgi:hypothetical protein